MSTHFHELIYQPANLGESCRANASPLPLSKRPQPRLEIQIERIVHLQLRALNLLWNLNFPWPNLEAETPDPVTAEMDLKGPGILDTEVTDGWAPVCAPRFQQQPNPRCLRSSPQLRVTKSPYSSGSITSPLSHPFSGKVVGGLLKHL